MYQELILLIIVFCVVYFMFIYDPRIDWMASDGKKYKIYKTDNNEINNKKAEIEKLRKKQILEDAKNTFNQIGQLAGKDSKIGKAMAINKPSNK